MCPCDLQRSVSDRAPHERSPGLREETSGIRNVKIKFETSSSFRIVSAEFGMSANVGRGTIPNGLLRSAF
jgi:hypothetical protein